MLGLLASAGIARENHTLIDRVYLNVKGVHEFSRREYVSRIFRRCPPVELVNKAGKIKFPQPMVERILDHRKAVLPLLGGVFSDTQPEVEEVLHIRMGDRHPTKMGTYLRVIQEHPGIRIIGSHPRYLRELAIETGCSFVEQDAVQDWLLVRKAQRVIGPVSTFTLSAMACSEQLKVFMLPQDGDIPAAVGEDLDTLHWLIKRCPRLEWFDAA